MLTCTKGAFDLPGERPGAQKKPILSVFVHFTPNVVLFQLIPLFGFSSGCYSRRMEKRLTELLVVGYDFLSFY